MVANVVLPAGEANSAPQILSLHLRGNIEAGQAAGANKRNTRKGENTSKYIYGYGIGSMEINDSFFGRLHTSWGREGVKPDQIASLNRYWPNGASGVAACIHGRGS